MRDINAASVNMDSSIKVSQPMKYTLSDCYICGALFKLDSMFNQNSNQFKYKQLWDELIEHIKRSVVIGNFRLQIKVYKECFTGENLVNNIYDFLKEKEAHFSYPILRINAIKIGSIMMGQDVFKGYNTSEFYDDSKKFYVFSEQSHSDKEDVKDINKEVNKFFIRDLIMVKLLTLVDVPILEGILTWEHEQRIKLNLTNISNLEFNKSSSKSFEDSYPYQNGWASSAITLLHSLCVFDNPLNNSSSNDNNSGLGTNGTSTPNNVSSCDLVLNIQLFHTICEYYTSKRYTRPDKDTSNSNTKTDLGNGQPLFPRQFLDIFTAILIHLSSRRFETALDIVKLLLNLLPPRTYGELMKLLEFIRAVANDHSIRLEADMSNIEICLKKFAPCIFDHQLFSPAQSEIILSFIINNMSSLHDARRDIYGLQDNSLASSTSILSTQDLLKTDASQTGLITFCEQMSNLSFKQQGEEVTQNELYKLLEMTMNDSKISEKQKHKVIKKFKNAHPEIYQEFLQAHKVNFII